MDFTHGFLSVASVKSVVQFLNWSFSLASLLRCFSLKKSNTAHPQAPFVSPPVPHPGTPAIILPEDAPKPDSSAPACPY
jgi:hypothetical protein